MVVLHGGMLFAFFLYSNCVLHQAQAIPDRMQKTWVTSSGYYQQAAAGGLVPPSLPRGVAPGWKQNPLDPSQRQRGQKLGEAGSHSSINRKPSLRLQFNIGAPEQDAAVQDHGPRKPKQNLGSLQRKHANCVHNDPSLNQQLAPVLSDMDDTEQTFNPQEPPMRTEQLPAVAPDMVVQGRSQAFQELPESSTQQGAAEDPRSVMQVPSAQELLQIVPLKADKPKNPMNPYKGAGSPPQQVVLGDEKPESWKGAVEQPVPSAHWNGGYQPVPTTHGNWKRTASPSPHEMDRMESKDGALTPWDSSINPQPARGKGERRENRRNPGSAQKPAAGLSGSAETDQLKQPRDADTLEQQASYPLDSMVGQSQSSSEQYAMDHNSWDFSGLPPARGAPEGVKQLHHSRPSWDNAAINSRPLQNSNAAYRRPGPIFD